MRVMPTVRNGQQRSGFPVWSGMLADTAPVPQVYLCASVPEPRNRLVGLFHSRGWGVHSLPAMDAAKGPGVAAAGAVILLVASHEGTDLGAQVRALTEAYPCPVLVLHASDQPQVRVAALNAGASDCLSEPAFDEELVARVAAVLRRRQGQPAVVSAAEREDGLVFRLGARSLVAEQKNGETVTVALTEKEIHIFGTLLRANGEPVSRQTLSERFFLSQGDRSVDVHICNIRSKLRRAGITGIELLGVRGIGYCLR